MKTIWESNFELTEWYFCQDAPEHVILHNGILRTLATVKPKFNNEGEFLGWYPVFELSLFDYSRCVNPKFKTLRLTLNEAKELVEDMFLLKDENSSK